MKGNTVHIFVVHSGITWAVARGVIEELGLDPEDVILALSRGFTAPVVHDSAAGYAVASLPFSHSNDHFASKAPLALARRQLEELDSRIRATTDGRRFHLYLPQSGQRWICAFMTHPLCVDYSYIEEGLGSYRAAEPRRRARLKKRLRDRIKYRGRVRDTDFIESGYAACYATSEDCFPGAEPVRIISPRFPPAPAPLQGLRHVIVCDGLAAHGLISTESDLIALERLREHMTRHRCTGVHFKLHPAMTSVDRHARDVRDLLRAAPLNATEIESDVVLESLANAPSPPTFWVNVSSTALYVSRMGAEAFTFAPLYFDVDARMEATFESLPRPFRERVVPIRAVRDEPR